MGGEQKTKLTLLAEALGFNQSARAVDVLTKAQDELAKKSAALEGAKLTGTLGEVEKLRGEQQALGGAIAELHPEQDKLNASERTYIGLLTQISPTLGSWVQGMMRGVKVAGDLASENLNLTSIFKGTTDAITKNAGGLALLGAGGLAVAGIGFLVNQIKKIGEEAEKAREGMEKLKKAQTDLERGEIASVRDIVAERDKDKRQKPFTFEQEESVRKTFEAAPESLREKLGPLLKQFGGAKGFGAAPGEFTGPELEALAERGFEADAAVGSRINLSRARRFLRREGTAAAAIQERQRLEEEATRRKAAEEGTSPESTEGEPHFEEILERAAKRRGVEPESIRKNVEMELWFKRYAPDVEPQRFEPFIKDFPEESKLLSPQRDAVDDVVRQLSTVAEKLDEASEVLKSAKPSVHIETYQPNAKNFGADANSFRSRSVNGASRATDAEGW